MISTVRSSLVRQLNVPILLLFISLPSFTVLMNPKPGRDNIDYVSSWVLQFSYFGLIYMNFKEIKNNKKKKNGQRYLIFFLSVKSNHRYLISQN